MKTYPYTHENGELSYEVVRQGDPKRFFQRHACPDSADGWTATRSTTIGTRRQYT